jgi:hypothetical protein
MMGQSGEGRNPLASFVRNPDEYQVWGFVVNRMFSWCIIFRENAEVLASVGIPCIPFRSSMLLSAQLIENTWEANARNDIC